MRNRDHRHPNKGCGQRMTRKGSLFGDLLNMDVLFGVVVGIAVSGVLLLIAWRTDDHLVEITLTTIAAYGSFLLAEHFHMSGVLASLTANLTGENAVGSGAVLVKGV